MSGVAWAATTLAVLQLCRPLSGAVMGLAAGLALPSWGLQLCRPLSGAVID